MVDTFYLDGIDARNFGIRIQRPVSISGAVPEVKAYSVPGRNGDLIIDLGSFRNRTGKIDCFALQNNVSDAVARASAFLLVSPGYRRLECSNDPSHYWMARIMNGAEVADRMRVLNPFKIKISCKPQRFLTAGDIPVELNGNDVLHNPYGMDARPLIKVYGTGAGALQIGRYTVKINSLEKVLYLDCDTSNAYNDGGNLNKNIAAPEFPVLVRGDNPVSFTGGISKLEITPRWADL